MNKILRSPDWQVFAGSSLLALAIYLGIARVFPSHLESPFLDSLLRLGALVFVGLLALVWRAGKSAHYKAALAIGVLSLFLVFVVALPLSQTSYAPGGVIGDRLFELAQIATFADSPQNRDFAYKDLPAFYPPLYYYLLGRLAAFSGLATYKVMKYGFLLLAFLLPWLTGGLWRPVSGPGRAAVLTLILTLAIYQDWGKPQVWLSLFLFVPWWLGWVETQPPSERRARWLWFLAGGLLGAAVFMLQYYWFLIAGVALLLGGWLKAAPGSDPPRLANKLWMLMTAALFSSLYWGPLLLSLLQTGQVEALQNRFWDPGFLRFELPFLNPTINGLFLLLGFVWLLGRWRSQPLAAALLRLALACWLWLALGYGLILLNQPILAVKANELLLVVLGAAACLAVFEILEHLLARPRPGEWLRAAGPVLTLALALNFAFRLALGFGVAEPIVTARQAAYPTALVAAYQQAAASSSGIALVDTHYRELLVYQPLNLYVMWNPHFNHPAARLSQRLDALKHLSRTADPAAFAARAAEMPGGPIELFLLRPTAAGYVLETYADDFPNPSHTLTFEFSESQFGDDHFEKVQVDEYVFFRARP